MDLIGNERLLHSVHIFCHTLYIYNRITQFQINKANREILRRKKRRETTISPLMALFNFWGCFSESSESSRFVCNGDVCVLRDHNKVIDQKKKKKISLRFPFSPRKS